MTTTATLPDEFAELAPFANWALDSWRERYDKRLESTMDEMQAFYDAKMPATCCCWRFLYAKSRSRWRHGASPECPTAVPPTWRWCASRTCSLRQIEARRRW